MKQHLILGLKGFAMGIAETIPGVSGGTIAFITGIYERLINCIKSFSPQLLTTFKNDGIAGLWKAIDGNFLVALGMGMFVGLVGGVVGVVHLLENYPPIIWAFFFGLIIASIVYIGRQVEHWKAGEIAGLVIAAALAFWITKMSPAQGNEALWYVFLSGAIAISALILPGISGSFILLIMGMYSFIIPTVRSVLSDFNTEGLTVMIAFAAGCAVGLFSFARVLSWTFKNYRSITLATLTGFMIGSLGKIWPWRNVLEYRTNSHDEQVPFIEEWVSPANYSLGEAYIVPAIVAFILGIAIVFLFSKMDKSNN